MTRTSVLIAVYNEVDYIAKTLESVIGMGYSKFI